MRGLDRYILKAFLINYVLALSVLVGMYILLDLIVNVQDFSRGASIASTAASASAWDIAGDMFDYYFYQFPVIFQQVSGIIPLLAAGFTMVRLTRHHELTAMLASGVSLYRVAAPIILASMAIAGLNIVNQEFVISQPYEIDKLLRKHSEVNVASSKNAPMTFLRDSDQTLLTAQQYFKITVPMGVKGPSSFVRAPNSGSFVADKIRKDMVIVTSGFANPANNGSFQVTDATEDTLTVAANTLRDEGSVSISLLAATVEAKNDPLIFVKDTDGSLLSAREYYPVRDVAVAVTGPHTFTRADSGSFLVDGVRKDLVITVAGFASKGDNGQFQVINVTDNAVTVAGNDLTPEAASPDSKLRAGQSMVGVFIVYRDPAGVPTKHTLATTAHWETRPSPVIPDDAWGSAQAGWVLRKAVTEDDAGRAPDARPVPYIIRATGTLQPDQIDLLLQRKVVDYLSSARLGQLAAAALDANKPALYKIMHLRFTQPLMNLILLLIGIPFLLTREPNRLVINMFFCVAVTGIVFIATFVMFQMAGTQIKDPLLGAWLPVLIFGPFSLVMLDFVRT